MGMRLYAAEFDRPDGTRDGFVVAPSSAAAIEFIRDFHCEAEISISRISVSRIDHKLPYEHQRGLDDVLEDAPIGFASQNEHIGWFVHSAVKPRLKYFRIDGQDGDVSHIIAPNAGTASAIWLASIKLDEDGCHPLWSISCDQNELCDRQRIALQECLEFGPSGVIAWDQERGWSHT